MDSCHSNVNSATAQKPISDEHDGKDTREKRARDFEMELLTATRDDVSIVNLSKERLGELMKESAVHGSIISKRRKQIEAQSRQGKLEDERDELVGMIGRSLYDKLVQSFIAFIVRYLCNFFIQNPQKLYVSLYSRREKRADEIDCLSWAFLGDNSTWTAVDALNMTEDEECSPCLLEKAESFIASDVYQWCKTHDLLDRDYVGADVNADTFRNKKRDNDAIEIAFTTPSRK